MEIRDGWATEYGRNRYDVTVQDQDLLLIFNENGIPAEHIGQLLMGEKWSVMTSYARWYAMTAALRLAGPDQRMEAASRVAAEAEQVRKVLAQFQARIGLTAPATANPYPEQASGTESPAA